MESVAAMWAQLKIKVRVNAMPSAAALAAAGAVGARVVHAPKAVVVL